VCENAVEIGVVPVLEQDKTRHMQNAGRRRLDSRESLLYGWGRVTTFHGDGVGGSEHKNKKYELDGHQRHNDTNEITKEKQSTQSIIK
jgi:hypothetical protein